MESLESFLPPVSLLIGPKSVGKWTMAEHLRAHYNILDSDLLRVFNLTADSSRMLVKFSASFPVGTRKLAIVRLDSAARNSLNTLLKTLEESFSFMNFILLAEEFPIPTIVSRAQVFRVGLLSVEEITQILVEYKGFNPDTALNRAQLSGGQVERALAVQDMKEQKMLVLRVLAAFRENNESILDELAPQWKDEHTELLTLWCSETITKRWKFFSEGESEIPGKSLPLRILMALRAEIRPRLVVRASLVSVLRGK